MQMICISNQKHLFFTCALSLVIISQSLLVNAETFSVKKAEILQRSYSKPQLLGFIEAECPACVKSMAVLKSCGQLKDRYEISFVSKELDLSLSRIIKKSAVDKAALKADSSFYDLLDRKEIEGTPSWILIEKGKLVFLKLGALECSEIR
jgi:hypothetical protein